MRCGPACDQRWQVEQSSLGLMWYFFFSASRSAAVWSVALSKARFVISLVGRRLISGLRWHSRH